MSDNFRGRMRRISGYFGRYIPNEVRYILALVIVSRTILAVVGVVSRFLLEPFHGKEYVWIYSKNIWLDIWGVWDSGWYLRIAAQGYPVINDPSVLATSETSYPFFPFYPLMMKLFSFLTGGLFTGGLVASNTALIFACFFLFKLVEKQYGREVAYRSLLFLIVFPTSFILSGVFTESLYLMLVLACFLAAVNGKWWIVGLCGIPLVLTRNLGILLTIPLAWIYMEQIGFNWRRVRTDILSFASFPAALAAYCVYVYSRTGDYLAFIHGQHAWGRNLSTVNPLSQLKWGLKYGEPHVQFRVVFTVILLAILCYGYKRIGFPAWFFGIYTIVVPLSSNLESMERYFVVVFPLAIIFGSIPGERVRDLAAVTLAVLQGFMMVFWANGFHFVV